MAVADKEKEMLDHGFPLHPPATMQPEPSQSTVPCLFTDLPPIRDDLVTQTSRLQDETVQECLPYLAGIHDPIRTREQYGPQGLAPLWRAQHADFLHDSLLELPSAFTAYDASRPWIVYWALLGLTLLDQDVTQYRER